MISRRAFAIGLGLLPMAARADAPGPFEIEKTEAEWREILTPARFATSSKVSRPAPCSATIVSAASRSASLSIVLFLPIFVSFQTVWTDIYNHRRESATFRRARRPEQGIFVMAWIFLGIAGLFEVVWATSMKYSEGFTRLWPTTLTVAAMAVSLFLLGLALRSLPLGTAYAIWTGIGTIGTAILGIVLFAEPAAALRLVCIGMIAAGIIGLKLVSP